MHRTGTKHIVRHMQKSVIQWSVISKFTCIVVPLKHLDAQIFYNCQFWAPSFKILAKTLPKDVLVFIHNTFRWLLNILLGSLEINFEPWIMKLSKEKWYWGPYQVIAVSLITSAFLTSCPLGCHYCISKVTCKHLSISGS